jgi:hypothetical protein
MTTSIETLGDRSGLGETAAGRMSRLTAQVRTIRTRGAANLDRWMLVIGGILMPLGIVLIILGWAGAARTPFAFEQNDYLISGGILGLALTFAGGFIYFGYWQTIRIRESRQQARELTDGLARLEALLAGGTVAVGGAAAGRAVVAGAAGRSFVATPSGTIYHRADCPAVAGRDDLKSVDSASTALKPCRICSPDAS